MKKNNFILKHVLTYGATATLVIAALSGCATTTTSSSSGNAIEATSESLNLLSYADGSSIDTSSSLLASVTAISDQTLSLKVYDLSSVLTSMPGGFNPGENPEEGEMPEPPEGQENEQPGGGGGFNLDLDSLTSSEANLEVKDDSVIYSSSARSIMSAFMGKGNEDMSFGSSDMVDLGSASSDSDNNDSQDSDNQDEENNGMDKQGMPGGREGFGEEETEISLSDIEVGDIILITFDDNGNIERISVIDPDELENMNSMKDGDFAPGEMPEMPGNTDDSQDENGTTDDLDDAMIDNSMDDTVVL